MGPPEDPAEKGSSKGKGKGKVKGKGGSVAWVPKHKAGEKTYQLRGWRLERAKGFEDDIEKLINNTEIKPTDFDELLLLFLVVLHRRGMAQDALQMIENRVKNVQRNQIKKWTCYIHQCMRSFDMNSYEALRGTEEYKAYKSQTRARGKEGRRHADPVVGPLKESAFPLNHAAPDFCFTGQPIMTGGQMAPMPPPPPSPAKSDAPYRPKAPTQLDQKAPEFDPKGSEDEEPSHPLIPSAPKLNRHAPKFVPQKSAPPFPESWAAALGAGKIKVDDNGQPICPFEDSVLPDIVQLCMGPEDVRLVPPLANAPWNDAPDLIGRDFKCSIVLSQPDASPPKGAQQAVVLIRLLIRAKDDVVWLSDMVEKCAQAGALGVLVEQNLVQQGHILKEGHEPTIPAVALSSQDYQPLQTALNQNKPCTVWMRSGRAAELKHRWIRETLIPALSSNDPSIRQVNLPAVRKDSKPNADFALTDVLVDEILAALKGNTSVTSLSLASPGISSDAAGRVQAWNDAAKK